MSLILEALKKSDAERQRSTRSPGALAAAGPLRRIARLRWALVLSAIFLSVAIGWYGAQKYRGSRDRQVATSQPIATPPATARQPQQTLPATPTPAGPATEPLPQTTASAGANTAKQPQAVASMRTPDAARSPTITDPATPSMPPAEPAEAPSHTSSTRPVKPVLVELEPAPVIPAALEPPARVQPKPAVPGRGLATLAQLPAATRSAIGDLTLNVHVFGAEAADRFVLINLHRYQEGDQLGEHLAVLKIRADGVVLEYEGTRFLLANHF